LSDALKNHTIQKKLIYKKTLIDILHCQLHISVHSVFSDTVCNNDTMISNNDYVIQNLSNKEIKIIHIKLI